MELAKLTGIKGVPVPARPAQPQSPGRTKKVSGMDPDRVVIPSFEGGLYMFIIP